MNTMRDPEAVVAAWLDEGPTDLPDATRRAILTALPTTPQARRGLLVPRRLPRLNPFMRFVAVALVAVIGLGAALYLIGQRPGVGGNPLPPTASPEVPSQPPAESAAQATLPPLPLDTAQWFSYPSTRYGYSLAYPRGWQTSPATEDWAGQTSTDMWVSPTSAPWADKMYSIVFGITMTALATTVPAKTTESAFINAYLAPPAGPTPSCRALYKDTTSIVIDGKPARLTPTCGDQTVAMAAFVFVGNRMFVFEVSDAKQPELFNALLSTVRLPKA